MVWARVLVCALLPVAVACGRETAPPPPIPLADCLPGVWVGEFPACPCVPGPDRMPTPECEEPDCVTTSVLVLREDGISYRYDATRSAAAGTITVMGWSCPPPRPWTLTEDGRLVFGTGGPDRAPVVECTAEQLDWSEPGSWNRAGGAFAETLSAFPEGPSCLAVPFDPAG